MSTVEHDWVGDHCPGDGSAEAVRAAPGRTGPGGGEETGGTAETGSGPPSRASVSEAEVLALLDALAAALDDPALTHEFEPRVPGSHWCGREVIGAEDDQCGQPQGRPVHRTSARVRAEHGFGPT